MFTLPLDARDGRLQLDNFSPYAICRIFEDKGRQGKCLQAASVSMHDLVESNLCCQAIASYCLSPYPATDACTLHGHSFPVNSLATHQIPVMTLTKASIMQMCVLHPLPGCWNPCRSKRTIAARRQLLRLERQRSQTPNFLLCHALLPISSTPLVSPPHHFCF